MHSQALERAFSLAKSCRLSTPPNPSVGCVIVSSDFGLIGEGHTQQTGGPHAEIVALRDAHIKGNSVHGSTAFVTLEPCSHRGRTGPCCDALISAGIAKVVAVTVDPNPLVSGQGLERLRAAGVAVELLPEDHPLAVEARELNIGFFSRMIRKRPWVRAKMASSLDGKTALLNHTSQWITSTAARQDGHAWRARSCAILTGIGTVLADNPMLNVRGITTPRQPHVVIVDAALQTPPTAALFDCPRRVFIYAARANEPACQLLEERGATVVPMPSAAAPNRVDLEGMLLDLAKKEINEVHVEAGQGLTGALLQAGLTDELLLYLAPKIIGPGMQLAKLIPIQDLDNALELEFKSIDRIGADLRIVARMTGHDRF